MNKRLVTASAACLLMMLSGCMPKNADNATSTSGQGQGQEKPPEPVTLKLYDTQQFNEADFAKLISEPLKKKYPYITVEKIDKSKGNTLNNVIATNQQFDLFTIWQGEIPSQEQLAFFEDMTPLFTKNKFDLNRFDQDSLQAVKAVSAGGLFGLPYNVQFNALFYNKDIFDKFGVAYPKDGMTWEETIELAKKVTRLDNGTQYRGLDPEGYTRLSFPLSLNILEPGSNKIHVNSEPYKRVFELGKTINDIPGNQQKGSVWEGFFKNRTTAMLAMYNIFSTPDFIKAEGLNWDVAQYPSYSDLPNKYGMYDLHLIGISKTSKYKDAALKVMEVLLSDEVQTASVRSTGRLSPLKDPKFKEAYGADMPLLKGKHIQSIFKSSSAKGTTYSKHYLEARKLVDAEYKNFLAGKNDVNTALRTAEEKISQYVAQQDKK
ncbi:ABC transporter substrate-binding protein [Paenibacillus allorhizosphaerae]|uniref:Extracellular solute-binding protein n=1 Tax=Paenibacillus allorhizosphaerae TaxID=2849866 RepID=A0ABM8VDC2_9BACL|nr:extracellular solute-binding protein [Paenibacillus allorhizosphaerae]CAG7627003.1 hypothetical protein PAECIP111802_01308 [Paenibacillus allorhizosphaerae]